MDEVFNDININLKFKLNLLGVVTLEHYNHNARNFQCCCAHITMTQRENYERMLYNQFEGFFTRAIVM